MSFDPNKPVEGTEIDAAELRDQFTGLKDEIDDKVSQAQHAVDHSTVLNTINSAVTASEATTAKDPLTVFPDAFNISDPPTQLEVARILDLVNATITALKRN